MILHMDLNPNAPMGRKAEREAVIPSAGGEKGLGQGWVCGGQMGSGVAQDGRDGARPYRGIWFIGFRAKKDWARGGCL